jgi:dihydroorotase
MARFDLLISGGEVATPEGLRRLDLAVLDGRVAAWLAPGTTADAADRMDAAGLVVMPGAVDAHVHFRDPGLTWKEDFASGTAAAAAGGVTTALVMPTDDPLTLTPGDLAAKRASAQGRLHVDIGLQALATGPDHVAALVAGGAVSIEVFLGDVPPALLVTDMGRFAAILEAAAAAGAVVGVTPADDGVIGAALAQVRPDGGTSDRLAFFRSRPPLSEAIGTAKAIATAAATKAAIHLRQVSCRDSLALLREARARGLDITGETTPHYLLLDEAAIERLGPVAKVLPPLRPEADMAALWAGLAAGDLAMVATDHAPHTEAEKAKGETDIWAAPGGFPGVQTLLPLMLDAVAAGRLDWARLVRLCCEAPAARFGLGARKGTLRPGMDADVVLVDPRRCQPVRDADQRSRARRTPFAGWELRGWPVATLLRGALAARDGQPVGAPRGQVLAPG